MTIKEYIVSKFQQFGITFSDADIADISLSVDIESEFSKENRNAVYLALVKTVIPQLLLRAKSISENGFSISWDNDALLKYYSWLCNELGIEDTINSKSKISSGTKRW